MYFLNYTILTTGVCCTLDRPFLTCALVTTIAFVERLMVLIVHTVVLTSYNLKHQYMRKRNCRRYL